jgi:hypothetical protein
MKMNVEHVKELNSKGEYPELDHSMLKEHGYTIQLEAGQHRFKVIQILESNEENNQWWIVKIYQRPLSEDAMMYLRNNDKIQHEKISDEERLWQCHRRQLRIDAQQNSTDPAIIAERKRSYPIDSTNGKAIERNERELQKLGTGRGTQIWSRPDLRDAVRGVLAIPGVRADFNISTLDDLLRYRMADVLPGWEIC